MPTDAKQTIQELEHTLRVLSDENAQLAERVEDSLLLGTISESIQELTDGTSVMENTLERIAILKAIPYATCGHLDGQQLTPIATYSTCSDEDTVGHPILLDTVAADGTLETPIVTSIENISCRFDPTEFAPATAALVPFTSQAFGSGVFLLLDDSTETDRLSAMIPLLNQVIDMAVAKYDNLFLVGALTRANTYLETRIRQRTKALAEANNALELEVAERKASAQALKEAHETFLTVLNSIDATIYVADLTTYEVLFANKCITDTFQRDITGEICHKSLRAEEAPCGICTNHQLVDSEGNPTGVVVWQGKNPVTGRWFVNYDRAIHWVDGRLVRLQIATDISQIKNLESQLQQTQKFEAIGTLAGGIAHDFNNLLMGIQGRASLMGVNLDASDPHFEHVHAIEGYVKSATDLTRQLLGFARGGKYDVKPTDVNDLVTNSATMFGRTKKEIRIHTKFCRPAPIVAADRQQIEQVLLNLYVNAWQAMPDGGELYLETGTAELDAEFCRPHQTQPGNYAWISVTDTGIGMDDATKNQIFDPFFTTKEKGRGTGLGLASAYGIINNHEGIITVSSDVGHGTTFHIYLAISDKEVMQIAPSETGLVNGKGTILLVDDEEIIRDVGQALLAQIGFDTIVANGGNQAMQFIQERAEEIDLVILDLIMPDMHGSAVFDAIRDHRPDMPVLLSSGYSLDGQAEDIMHRGCNGFIQKPFDISKLSQKILKILDETNFANSA